MGSGSSTSSTAAGGGGGGCNSGAAAGGTPNGRTTASALLTEAPIAGPHWPLQRHARATPTRQAEAGWSKIF